MDPKHLIWCPTEENGIVLLEEMLACADYDTRTRTISVKMEL